MEYVFIVVSLDPEDRMKHLAVFNSMETAYAHIRTFQNGETLNEENGKTDRKLTPYFETLKCEIETDANKNTNPFWE